MKAARRHEARCCKGTPRLGCYRVALAGKVALFKLERRRIHPTAMSFKSHVECWRAEGPELRSHSLSYGLLPPSKAVLSADMVENLNNFAVSRDRHMISHGVKLKTCRATVRTTAFELGFCECLKL